MAEKLATAAPSTRAERLIGNWVYGGVLAGIMLLGLTPVLTAGWPIAEVFVFLTLPAYMIHQYEEHDDDRFRRFMNEMMGGGRDVLTPLAVFVVNIFGVWMTLALCIVLTRSMGAGFGAFAGWFVLVNAVIHVLAALHGRRYNPGLVTALLLFIPLGIAVLAGVWPEASATQIIGGLVIAIGLHAAIIIHMKRRLSRL